MKTDTKSHNTRSDLALKELLVPTGPKIWLDVTLAILLLIFLNARGLWLYFTTGVLDADQTDVSDVINEKAQGFHHFLDTISKGRFLQVVFWLFVGCVVYMIVWFLRSILTNIRNDIVADEYVHPMSYNRNVYWESVIARKLFFVSVLVIFVAYIIIGFKLAIVLASLCYNAIANHQWSHTFIVISASIIVTALMVQVLTILMHLLGRAWQLIYTDL